MVNGGVCCCWEWRGGFFEFGGYLTYGRILCKRHWYGIGKEAISVWALIKLVCDLMAHASRRNNSWPDLALSKILGLFKFIEWGGF